ncbi:MAG: hypothetical protein J6A96_06490 [Clostridia bacterium]|nr:hypothetical protein [Clostridia bacterium]
MFAKLFKYDMKSISKAGIPTLICVAGLSVLGFLASLLFVLGATHSGLIREAYTNAHLADKVTLANLLELGHFAAVMATVAMIIAVFGIQTILKAFPVVITVITVVNFYKTLITDEGYLTFTLPVHPVKILTSKLLNSVVWSYIVSITTTIASFVILAPMPLLLLKYEWLKVPFTEMIPSMLKGFEWYDIVGGITNILLSSVLSFLTVVTTQLLYFLAVFLGGVVAKKQKLVAGGGFIVAGHILFEIIKEFIAFGVMVATMTLTILSSFITEVILENWEIVIPFSFIPVTTTLLQIGAFLLLGGGLFAITSWLMTKKLNLP